MNLPIMAFGCGVAYGIILMRRELQVQPERYQPTTLEREVANLLEVDDLELGAYLYGGEGLVGMVVKEQMPS
jgi:hypothetical protein